MEKLDLIEGADAAARYLGITRRKVYYMVEHGHLPAIRCGRKMLFRKAEIDRHLSAARTKTARPLGWSKWLHMVGNTLTTHGGDRPW